MTGKSKTIRTAELPHARRRRTSKVVKTRFTAIFERKERWFVGYVPAVPGVNAQERTLSATRKSLAAALEELAEIDPQALRVRSRRIEQIEVRVSA